MASREHTDTLQLSQKWAHTFAVSNAQAHSRGDRLRRIGQDAVSTAARAAAGKRRPKRAGREEEAEAEVEAETGTGAGAGAEAGTGAEVEDGAETEAWAGAGVGTRTEAGAAAVGSGQRRRLKPGLRASRMGGNRLWRGGARRGLRPLSLLPLVQ